MSLEAYKLMSWCTFDSKDWIFRNIMSHFTDKLDKLEKWQHIVYFYRIYRFDGSPTDSTVTFVQRDHGIYLSGLCVGWEIKNYADLYSSRTRWYIILCWFQQREKECKEKCKEKKECPKIFRLAPWTIKHIQDFLVIKGLFGATTI